MFIKSISLKNWRNYSFEEISFSDEKNLIFGENAQGKTNLIEAIFHLSCLKNFRGGKEADSIMYDMPSSEIKGIFNAYGREIEVSCSISKKGRSLFVNGVKITRPTEHIGLIKTVVFSPDDLQLIKEGPALRRRFMNIAISQLRPSYVKALSEHKRIIENKRKILKSEENREKYYDYYDILNEKLARSAAIITYERGLFLKKLLTVAEKVANEISNGREELSLSYVCDSAVDDFSAKDNAERIYEHLKKRKSAEFESLSCLVGAHRDDFEVKINGGLAKDFASQGQIRSAVLAIKIAEHKIFEEDSGEKPILLLDDVLSELDIGRREFLLNNINSGQSIITGCDPSMFSELKRGKIFTVENGKVISKKENFQI